MTYSQPKPTNGWVQASIEQAKRYVEENRLRVDQVRDSLKGSEELTAAPVGKGKKHAA